MCLFGKHIPLNLIIGSIIILTFSLTGIFATIIAPYDHEEMHIEHIKKAPSSSFYLGTDRFGRDVFSRVIVGTRSTLIVAFGSAALALVIGIAMGTISAFCGKMTDNIIMRINDIFMSFPTLIFAILIVGALGPSMLNVILSIGIIYAPRVSRIVRSAALSIVPLEYIDAAKVRGESSFYIIVFEIVPNLWPTIIVEGSIRVGYSILLSAGMGYIGLGPPPPTPDWGLMAATEKSYMLLNPWPVFAPCIAIVIAVIGVNIFGEGIKDLLRAKGSKKENAIF